MTGPSYGARVAAAMRRHEIPPMPTKTRPLLRLRFRRPLRVVVARDWRQFNPAAPRAGEHPRDEMAHALLAHPEYLFHPAADPRLDRMPPDVGGPFMLAEYRVFVEYLAERFGEEGVRRLVLGAVDRPAGVRAVFAETFGASLDSVGAEFVAAVRAGRRASE